MLRPGSRRHTGGGLPPFQSPEKEEKEEDKQQKEVLTLIDEEDVNAVFPSKSRHPKPPSTAIEPPAYSNSGATSGLRPLPSSPLLDPLYPTGELKTILKRDETQLTRSGKNFSSAWKVYREPAGVDVENLPMIQVPNPRDGEGESQFMYVYRPWTAEDVRKATEDIPHPKLNVKGFEDGIKNVSYRLNGLELEQSLRNVMKGDWCMICGDWSSITTRGAVLQFDSTDLTNRLEALLKRIETKI